MISLASSFPSLLQSLPECLAALNTFHIYHSKRLIALPGQHCPVSTTSGVTRSDVTSGVTGSREVGIGSGDRKSGGNIKSDLVLPGNLPRKHFRHLLHSGVNISQVLQNS